MIPALSEAGPTVANGTDGAAERTGKAEYKNSSLRIKEK